MKVYAVEAKTWGRLDMQSGTLKKRTIAVIAAFAAVIVLMAPMTAHASTSYVSDVKKKDGRCVCGRVVHADGRGIFPAGSG